MNFLFFNQIMLHLYLNVGLSSIRKENTSNFLFIVGLEPRIHYLNGLLCSKTLFKSYQYISNPSLINDIESNDKDIVEKIIFY